MEKISFCVTYYNQAPFVKQSLNSIFSMDIPCDFEILIGDDGSSDSTINEVQKFIDKFPDKIKLFIQERKETKKTINRASLNRLNLAKHAQGNYILFLDGDDCYCDNTFVKRSLDILQKNKNITACCAGFKLVYTDKEDVVYKLSTQDKIINSKTYISEGYYIHSGAFIFKNILNKEKLEFLEKINNFDDNAITIYMLQSGDIYSFDTVFYSYTQCSDSLWNLCSETEKDILNALDYNLISKTVPEYKLQILQRQYNSLKNTYRKRNEIKELLNDKFEKYLDLSKSNNDKFILNIINWNNLKLHQRLWVYLKWKKIKLSKKYNLLLDIGF